MTNNAGNYYLYPLTTCKLSPSSRQTQPWPNQPLISALTNWSYTSKSSLLGQAVPDATRGLCAPAKYSWWGKGMKDWAVLLFNESSLLSLALTPVHLLSHTYVVVMEVPWLELTSGVLSVCCNWASPCLSSLVFVHPNFHQMNSFSQMNFIFPNEPLSVYYPSSFIFILFFWPPSWGWTQCQHFFSKINRWRRDRYS